MDGLGNYLRGLGREEALPAVRAAGTAPGPRESHTCTCVGSRLFLFGGFDGSKVLNDLYVYDLNSSAWERLVNTPATPAPRAGHAAATLGLPAHLVVFGGADATRRFADIHLLDTMARRWEKPPVSGRAPLPRYYHTMALAHGSFWVFGGDDGSGALADLQSLDASTWVWSQPATHGAAPSPRYGHACAVVNQLLFIIGGVSQEGPTLGEIYVLDVGAMSWWRPKPAAPPPPLAFMTAALSADRIFIHGGSTRGSDSAAAVSGLVWAIDTASCECSRVYGDDGGLRLPPRQRHSVARGAGTRLLFFGGWDGVRTTAGLHELDTSPLICGDAAIGALRPVRESSACQGGAAGGGAAHGGGRFEGFRSGVSAAARQPQQLELQLERHEIELKHLRGEVARLKVANALLTKDVTRMKALAGVQVTEGGGGAAGGGVDMEELASKKEILQLRAELSRARTQAREEAALRQGEICAELEVLKRDFRHLEYKSSLAMANSNLVEKPVDGLKYP